MGFATFSNGSAFYGCLGIAWAFHSLTGESNSYEVFDLLDTRTVAGQRLKKMVIVEDDLGTSESIALTFELGFDGVEIRSFDRITPAFDQIEQIDPDLITIDLGLPDGDGLQLIRKIRDRSDIPIIVLSARGDDSTVLTAVRLGADAFLVKPFSAIALQAHVEALIRRINRPTSSSDLGEPINLAPGILLDLGEAKIVYHGVDIPVSARELDCLSLLVQANGKIVTIAEFKERVWGSNTVTDSAIKMVFYRLRKSLGDDPAARMLVQSHRGIGYSLVL